MTSLPGNIVGPRPALLLTLAKPRWTKRLLDALLTREATRTWWILAGGLFLTAVILHATALVAFPTVATPDSDEYCAVLHEMEAMQVPSLLKRNIGYPLFMLLCKALPLPLYKGLPLVQHLLWLAAVGVVMVFMRRVWGVLAGLAVGALLCVNSVHALFCHYAQPNALLFSLVPVGVITLMAYLVVRRWWHFPVAAIIWSIVFMTREEVLLIAFVPPIVAFVFHRRCRKRCLKWGGPCW